MERTHGNLKKVLIALLSLVLVLSVAFASIAIAQPTSEPIEIVSGDKALTVSIDAQRLDDITADSFKTKGKELLSAVEDILLSQILPDNSQEAGIATVANGDLLGKYADKLREKLSEEGELDKYLNGEYDLLIKQAAAKYFEEHDTDVTAIVEEVQGIVNEVIAQYKDQEDYYVELTEKSQSKIEELQQTVQAIADGAPAMTLDDVIASLETLEIGGNAIRYQSDWKASAVKSLLADFSNQLKAVDSEFVIAYPVHIEMPFGTGDITLTVQFTNYNGSTLKSVVDFAKQTVDFGKTDGVWTLNVNVPESLLQIYNYLPENAQKDLFSNSSTTVADMFGVVEGYTVEQIKDILSNIDYQGLFGKLIDNSRSEVNAAVNVLYRLTKAVASKKNVAEVEQTLRSYGLGVPAKLESALQKVLDKLQSLGAANWSKDQFTSFLKTRCNAEIKDVIAQFDGTSAFETVQRYIKQLKDYVPAEFLDIALTEIVENGELSWAGTVDVIGVTYDPLLDKIAKVAANVFNIDKVVLDKVISWIDNNVKYQDVDVSVSATLPEISKVTYKYNDKSVTGLLPNGVSVSAFAPATIGKNGQAIVAWYDGKAVVETVNGDATYTAVTTFNTEIEVDGIGQTSGEHTKTYDKQGFTLTAYPVGGEGNNGYTYQWYYKKDASATAQRIIGATSARLSKAGDVADSGIYFCTITSTTVRTNWYSTKEVTVTINRKSFTLSGDTWNYTSALTYNGKEQSVDLTSDAKAALNAEFGPKWIVTGNTATAVGKYTAKVEVDASLLANYAIDIADLSWEIKANPDNPDNPDKPPVNPDDPDDPTKPVNPNGERGHEFTFTADGTSVTIKDVTGAINKSYVVAGGVAEYGIGYFKEALEAAGKNTNASILQILDLHFTDANGATQSVKGTFEVTLSNNDKFGSVQQSDLIVIHIHDGKQTVISATSANGAVTFTVENFSEFAIMSNVSAASDEVDAWWLWLLLAIVIILNIVIILLLLLRRKSEEPEPSEPTAEETDAADTTEEQAEQEEETTYEPEEEQALEEQVAATEPVEEQPETETQSLDKDVLIVVPDDTEEYKAMDYSFTARISQADGSVKSNYYTIKSELLSYKKIRSRISWKYESFYKGRAKCAILQLRGKKINLYLALKAEDLARKYHAKDVSNKSLYANVPTLVKITGRRSLLYSKQLIEALMSNLNVEHGVPQKFDRIPRKSTKALIEEGLIKFRIVDNSFLAGKKAETQQDSEKQVAAAQASTESPSDEDK